MIVTAAGLAQRFIGIVHERPGNADDPLILAMLQLCSPGTQHDEVAWCSAFVNFVAHLLGLPRSKSLAARSWLLIGEPIPLAEADQGENDVVILSRGTGGQPGPTVISAPGHVGFFLARQPAGMVQICGGNQGNSVTRASFSEARVLGVRRLREE